MRRNGYLLGAIAHFTETGVHEGDCLSILSRDRASGGPAGALRPAGGKAASPTLETAIGVRRSIELRHDVGVTESG